MLVPVLATNGDLGFARAHAEAYIGAAEPAQPWRSPMSEFSGRIEPPRDKWHVTLLDEAFHTAIAPV